jgi:protein-L-isoaspartate(D-aspartate) O-methyltransferase
MDFERARFNMVEQQIRPWEVLDPVVLDLLFHVKREDFTSENQRSLAFADVELPLPNGSRMLQPKMEARMLQDLAIQSTDKALEIGTGSGYVTALLSHLAAEVISLDTDESMLNAAKEKLHQAGCDKNVRLIHGNGLTTSEDNGPFNVILVGGSTPVVPEFLKRQLAVGGRMLVTVGDLPVMAMHLVRRTSEGEFSDNILFETCLPRLQGCEAIEPERFQF